MNHDVISWIYALSFAVMALGVFVFFAAGAVYRIVQCFK